MLLYTVPAAGATKISHAAKKVVAENVELSGVTINRTGPHQATLYSAGQHRAQAACAGPEMTDYFASTMN